MSLISIQFDTDLNILAPQTLANEKSIVLLNSSKEQSTTVQQAEFLAGLALANTTITPIENIKFLDEGDLQEILSQISPKIGQTFFDLRDSYNWKECVRTVLQYLRDYGNFDIPQELYLPLKNLKNYPIPQTQSQWKFVGLSEYAEALDSILQNTKNPSSDDYRILYALEECEYLTTGTINNRTVLEHICKSVRNFKFKPQNTAELRVFCKNRKLTTSEKSLVVRSIDALELPEVLDDFAANRHFWKRIERKIIPTQRKFRTYRSANLAFEFLRDNNFKNSNNSNFERSLETSSGEEVFEDLIQTKSLQFALRNFTKIFKRCQSTDLDKVFEIIKSKNPKIKVLLELYSGLCVINAEKDIKIKNKFYTKEPKHLTNIADFDEFKTKLKNLIKDLLKSKLEEYAKLLKDENSEAFKTFKKIPNLLVKQSTLDNAVLPVSTENYLEIDPKFGYLPRGSKIKVSDFVNPNEFVVFVSWKRKDNTESQQDLDLSALKISKNVESFKDVYKNFEYSDYTQLLSNDGTLKHSGDFTSCQAFNPLIPFITTEAILVKNPEGILSFQISTFNAVSLKEFDVYIGIANFEDFKSFGDGGTQFNLENAKFIAKIDADFNGFYKMFSIQDGYLTLEGQGLNEHYGNSGGNEALNAFQSFRWTSRLQNLKLKDFIDVIGDYNPAQFKAFLDYAINIS